MQRMFRGDLSLIRVGLTTLAAAALQVAGIHSDPAYGVSDPSTGYLHRAKVFLAAGDYKRAIEACQREIEAHPSAESYVYLTYVYHALDGYLEHLAKTDRWVAVEQLFLNLATGRPEDLVDPPDVLARIAKEIIQSEVRRQSDISASMAARLDKAVTERLWKQQTAWRAARPDDWWFGVPDGWGW